MSEEAGKTMKKDIFTKENVGKAILYILYVLALIGLITYFGLWGWLVGAIVLLLYCIWYMFLSIGILLIPILLLLLGYAAVCWIVDVISEMFEGNAQRPDIDMSRVI